MSEQIPSRVFATVTSYQLDGEVTVIGSLYKATYRLDTVGERGATLRVTSTPRFGTQQSTVSLVAVTPQASSRYGLTYDTRKAARAAVGA